MTFLQVAILHSAETGLVETLMKESCTLAEGNQEQGLNSCDDDVLMDRIAKGDIEMLGQLYLRYDLMVRSAIRRFAPEISAAEQEELTQDIFLLLHRKAAQYEGRGRFKPYLYGIAVKKTRIWRRNTWLRRRLLGGTDARDLPFGPQAESSPVDTAAKKEAVVQILNRLPAKHKEVLLLHSVEGFSGDEIGEILGISAKTVRTRLFRARQAILENANRNEWLQVLPKELP
jgi:RNA polymerase sigma-70 factor (ECF subfamily)